MDCEICQKHKDYVNSIFDHQLFCVIDMYKLLQIFWFNRPRMGNRISYLRSKNENRTSFYLFIFGNKIEVEFEGTVQPWLELKIKNWT